MIEYLALGFVQGMTEFLPVSSSGHLYLLQYWFGWIPSLELEVLLHVASLVAVMTVFWKQLIAIAKSFFDSGPSEERALGIKLIVATLFTLPTALLTEKLFLYDLSLEVVAWSLIVTGGLVFLSHLLTRKEKREERRKFVWTVVILIGLIQGFAVLPGISRSGLTIAALMMLGMGRKNSAEISFLLSIPTILGAFVFKLQDLGSFPELSFPLIFALLVCALVSWLTIRFMLQTIQKYWIYFMPYCVLLGVALLLW